ncbi:MFS transporter [Litorihabitans aurantiacus]|uniref:MFS transporter n=1 Tax=Litorihabitans aurantiacus TaxID=1930061 RepID=A0AA37XG99_9MICO|nr:MFS transporter [Litorihabitans aurantiacus]GMA32730.1 MFS transporter [Litorihabitans aurantiacus]
MTSAENPATADTAAPWDAPGPRTSTPRPPLSRARTRLALLALALGGFGIGTTEFVAMGLLPQIAQDLLPETWTSGSEQAIAHTGGFISAYALGVVLGAPTIAATVARFPRRRLLVIFTSAFAVATLLSAAAPTYELAIVARFVAGLPHGAYFGIAALVAAQLMGPGNRGKGVALVLSGLTVANVVGVPLITALGQRQGWRVAYLAVTGVFVAATLAVALLVPQQQGDAGATVRRELSSLRRGQVWFALGIGSIGFGGFFAIYSYVAPLVNDVAGLGQGVVPWALVLVGVGMTVGNFAGGVLADRGALRSVLRLFPVFIVVMVVLALTASTAALLLPLLFLVGAVASALSPTIQTRLMDVAGDSQTLAAALNHSSLNIGNFLGAALGAAVISAGLGYEAPTWVGVALAVAGLALALASRAVERRGERAAGGDVAAVPDAHDAPVPAEAVAR